MDDHSPRDLSCVRLVFLDQLAVFGDLHFVVEVEHPGALPVEDVDPFLDFDGVFSVDVINPAADPGEYIERSRRQIVQRVDDQFCREDLWLDDVEPSPRFVNLVHLLLLC